MKNINFAFICIMLCLVFSSVAMADKNSDSCGSCHKKCGNMASETQDKCGCSDNSGCGCENKAECGCGSDCGNKSGGCQGCEKYKAECGCNPCDKSDCSCKGDSNVKALECGEKVGSITSMHSKCGS